MGVTVMTGIEIIAAERQRQIDMEGWSAERDAQVHPNGQLARAAENYVRFAAESDTARDYQRENGHTPGGWPWHYSWWKPSNGNRVADRIRDLAKAGALIAAEIDRLQKGGMSKMDDKQNENEAADGRSISAAGLGDLPPVLDASVKYRRWNFDTDDEGLLVCRGLHDGNEHCEAHMERLSPSEALVIINALRSECLKRAAKDGIFYVDFAPAGNHCRTIDATGRL